MDSRETSLAAELEIMRSKIGPRPRTPHNLTSQRRQIARKPTNKAICLWRYTDGVPCNPEAAIIIDISPAGVGLVLAAPMELGVEFLINLPPSDASLVYRAVQCHHHDADWYRVGAEFVHHLPGNDMASLEQDIERIRNAILA